MREDISQIALIPIDEHIGQKESTGVLLFFAWITCCEVASSHSEFADTVPPQIPDRRHLFS